MHSLICGRKELRLYGVFCLQNENKLIALISITFGKEQISRSLEKQVCCPGKFKEFYAELA
jgi:hypothetical protein